MNVLSRRSGFSLIELLTVIAIIAILAAIIFPVMGMVKDRARQSECMTNMHQIAMAAQLFKQDNRKYPDVLGAKASDANGKLCTEPGSGAPVPFDQAKTGDGSLFPEYSKSSTRLFHCATSKVSSTSEVFPKYTINYGKYSVDVITYKYDTYTNFVDGSGNMATHYAPCWAPSVNSDEASIISAVVGSTCQPYESGDDTAKQLADYERQLKFRNPPGDTILTWCSNHENRAGTNVSGQALVVFLDGHTENQPAGRVEACKWRTRPKP